MQKKNIMDLMKFRMDLAENLVLVGKPVVTNKEDVHRERCRQHQSPHRRGTKWTQLNQLMIFELNVPALIHSNMLPSVKIKVAIDEHIIIVRSVAVIYAWIK